MTYEVASTDKSPMVSCSGNLVFEAIFPRGKRLTYKLFSASLRITDDSGEELHVIEIDLVIFLGWMRLNNSATKKR